MVMQIKKFYLTANGKIFDVYLRPTLIALGVNYDLRVACRNLRKEKKVEIIVNGTNEDIQQFWEYVKGYDVRPVKNEKAYQVSEIEPYEGLEPDWTFHMSASTMEQLSKGIASLEGINKSLESIDDKFGKLEDKFGIFGLYAKGMDEKLDTLPEKIAEALDKRKSKKPR